jgi:hypothetical protein
LVAGKKYNTHVTVNDHYSNEFHCHLPFDKAMDKRSKDFERMVYVLQKKIPDLLTYLADKMATSRKLSPQYHGAALILAWIFWIPAPQSLENILRCINNVQFGVWRFTVGVRDATVAEGLHSQKHLC